MACPGAAGPAQIELQLTRIAPLAERASDPPQPPRAWTALKIAWDYAASPSASPSRQ